MKDLGAGRGEAEPAYAQGRIGLLGVPKELQCLILAGVQSAYDHTAAAEG
jgi:hypothetical protein